MPSHATGAARYLTNGASDSALDELVAEARNDATVKAARVTRAGGTLTTTGVIVWKPASTCVEIKILRRARTESPRRPPRHQRDACSMAWRCRFLAARPSQDSRAIAAR